MKATLKVVNQMQADGVIGSYAIGGAIGATFYLEPAATFDIDIFVSLKNVPGSSLVSLEPIYSYLKTRGYKSENEYIVIEGWQVQFLPPGDALDEEALAEAVKTHVDEIKTRVMTAEHLTAIALKVGRAKDKIRIAQFIESGVLDEARLNQILVRHGLLAKWKEFKHKYIEDNG
jgi:2C-methyl-D-erythritol 2,4-cyclodiphosphate synthase